MKKGDNSKSTLLSAVGILSALVGIGIWAWRTYKKEEKRIVSAQEAADKEIKDLGVSPEKMKEEVTEHEEESERNFVKALYAVVTSPESGLNENYFDLSEICDEEKKLLHVMEDIMSGNRCLKFLIKDVISACKDSGKYVMAQILKRSVNEDPAWSKMVAVMEYSYAIEGSETRKIQLLEIPNWILKKIYDEDDSEKKNKAVRLYEDWSDPKKIAKIQEKVGSDFDLVIQRDAIRKAEAEGDEIIVDSIKGRSVELMYSLGFKEEELFGDQKNNCLITLTQANEIIEYFVNDFEIKRVGKKDDNPAAVLDEFSIGGVMFHAPNKCGRFDSMARFYDTNSKGKIYIDSFKEGEEKPIEPEPVKDATPEQLSDLAIHFGCGRKDFS